MTAFRDIGATLTESIAYGVSTIALQPTTFCNLDCAYCYLANREKQMKMSPAVARRVAETLPPLGPSFRIIWHAGEPLATGLAHFQSLLEPFAPLIRRFGARHVVQTNATLITEEWCALFELHKFHVGVSLDGPEWANIHRKSRSGQHSYAKIREGIERLKARGIPFSVIAVVTETSIQRADELYDFFCDLGCFSLGINLEEREGVNIRPACDDNLTVATFWRELYSAWRRKPSIEVREFASVLSWMAACSSGQLRQTRKRDIFPTVSWKGDVVLLSPELLSAMQHEANAFIVGNVLETGIETLVAPSRSYDYVDEFSRGVSRCEAECDYFSFCRGGQASNKFYETGSLDCTETRFCRNSQKRLVNAVLEEIISHQS